MNRKQKRMLIRIGVTTVLTAVLVLLPDVTVLPLGGVAKGLLYYLVCYIIIGSDILRKTWKGICNGRMFDENLLMTVATLGAFTLAVCEQSGDYLEAIAVMLFYQVGEFFQSYAVGKSRDSITELMNLCPDYANLEQEDGSIERVDPDEVEVGQVIVVQPGERIPIDGIIIGGHTTLNTSALTGESLPREANEGDEVMSGCINETGVIRVETTKECCESTAARILELVEDSASHKSKTENFIVRFARVYTPFVCCSALLLALLPPIVRLMLLDAEPLCSVWAYRALTFLVISCPCALVVSIPLTFFAGIGGAGRKGILVKGADVLETLAKVKTVAMDKTGTLTKGVFEVVSTHVSAPEYSKQDIIDLAAMAESASSHPIARSLVAAYGQPIDRQRVSDVNEISGHGVIATIDGRCVCVGNSRLMDQQKGLKNWRVDEGLAPRVGETIVHVACEGTYIGKIALGDVVRPSSAEAIDNMKKAGVKHTVMLTGDSWSVADKVANQLGLDEACSELLPADKVSQVEALMESHEGALAFVGDGINDAPVLTRADVGIAMGAIGSDAAIEAADVVLTDDDPRKVAVAIGIARRTIGIVWQNIVLALGVKGVCLLLGAFGIADMWLAIFADVGVMMMAVLNAIRAMIVKK